MKMTSSIIVKRNKVKVHRRTVVKQVSSWETPNVKYIYSDRRTDGWISRIFLQRYQRDIKSHVSICVNSVDVIKISGKGTSSFLVVVLVVVVVVLERRSIAIANAWTHDDDARGRTDVWWV
jgi:hypothetical protein